MWIDPLVKWRTADPSPGFVELLAGQPETALSLFTEAGDLVGQGDALVALGRQDEAVERFEQATPEGDLKVECGLSQALVLQGEASAAVLRLEKLLVAYPGNAVVLHHLTGALLETADQARNLTRDEEHVITSQTQFEVCAGVARRAAETAVDDNHRAGVEALTAELTTGSRWTWSSQPAVLGYSLLGGLVGLGLVGIGGSMGNIVLVVLGAILGAIVIYLAVMSFRRQAWQIRAVRAAPLVWRHGLR
ncbi:hypothetical protein LWC34_35425 [Kibdelosporangium philippinense]|uniref:Tetratricopeptide repeat protein n=1 Tax=Kibdelosporangium philippinense TaxID=211113 RepID=A0ABS8ZJX4_9PSEU|nr:hypothetical protein [Kibdelosporangium philippinense]MCE7008076.1 hypothetical protein [Kibdelosporangium philippinense]